MVLNWPGLFHPFYMYICSVLNEYILVFIALFNFDSVPYDINVALKIEIKVTDLMHFCQLSMTD